ncbi:hypothetical protein BO82DRAFT_389623 [Aspergillus uvarum CBS 121591]|uniref:GST C-terminal domain-containing protein n=1 Tax=Aspergillus uvarum CBS 121591 TaxID=1448315 RepID=A0A319CKD3_9EURO|nr:hypothetical protein BO82DRAFT_389623 [Aspergillus uvarum CBS 121591]PYH85010.1 hypothetical protein BO82DRAFT_389623 [Aspergillus uvarum CBS 121591]
MPISTPLAPLTATELCMCTLVTSSLFESHAFMLYLFHTVNRAQQFGFAHPLLQSQVLQWTVFWAVSGQPVQGQWNYFRRRGGGSTQDEHTAKKFHDDLRVYHVLEAHLSARYADDAPPREYLAGPGTGKDTLADINAWACVRNLRGVGLEEEESARLPALAAWVERVGARGGAERRVWGGL